MPPETAEAEETVETQEGSPAQSEENIVEEGKEAPGKAEKASVDWKEGLDEEQLKTANRFASPKEMVRSIQSARQRESLARVPGKDSTKEEIAKYHKAIGVPATPDGYNFQAPEGVEMTPEMEAQNKAWGEVLHKANVPVETVNTLVAHIQEQADIAQKAELKADAAFVAEGEADLKAEWKGEEYGRNVEVANKAFKEAANRAGVNLENLTGKKTENGRFLMDDPDMLRIFSVFGRDMAEGTLGPTLTDGERDTAQEQLTEIRGKISAAQEKGDTKTANRLFKTEQDLISRMDGNKPVR